MIPLCPITGLPLQDPVVDPDGNTYERSAILQWLESHSTSPLTRHGLDATQLVPNRAVQAMIRSAMAELQEANAAGEGISPVASLPRAAFPKNNETTTWQVFVKTIDNRVLVLDVSNASTVADVKALVQGQTGLSVEEQRLIYAGKEMNQLEGRVWHEYHVPPRGTIHLVLRLRGGGAGVGVGASRKSHST